MKTNAIVSLTGWVLLQWATVCGIASAQSPPTPPQGFKWVKNDAFSDEFNGTELDRDKWYDHNPRWKGRPPGKFMPSAISVKDGYLQIKSSVLDPQEDEFTIACGAVQSKAQDALYGYYECRVKASGISTSTTFWLKCAPVKTQNGTLSLELDILECIGNAQRWPNFRTHMMSNTHQVFRPNEQGAEAINVKKGGSTRLQSPVDADFHTYGCWWVDANTLKFYADGKHVHTIEPPTEISKTPFDRPMVMNLICETYAWEVPPTVEELNDDSRNTTYYDYVRSYKLVAKTDENQD